MASPLLSSLPLPPPHPRVALLASPLFSSPSPSPPCPGVPLWRAPLGFLSRLGCLYFCLSLSSTPLLPGLSFSPWPSPLAARRWLAGWLCLSAAAAAALLRSLLPACQPRSCLFFFFSLSLASLRPHGGPETARESLALLAGSAAAPAPAHSPPGERLERGRRRRSPCPAALPSGALAPHARAGDTHGSRLPCLPAS